MIEALALEEAILGLLIDRAGYLHGGDIDRLRRDLRHLRVRFRDPRSLLILDALHALAAAGRPVTATAVASAAGLCARHVWRLVGRVWDCAIVDYGRLQDLLLDLQRRQDLGLLARVLRKIAAQAGLWDVEIVTTELAPLFDVLQRVHIHPAAPTTAA